MIKYLFLDQLSSLTSCSVQKFGYRKIYEYLCSERMHCIDQLWQKRHLWCYQRFIFQIKMFFWTFFSQKKDVSKMYQGFHSNI